MPWTQVDEVLFAESDDARYKFLELPTTPGVIAWAVALEVTSAITAPRRRTGFIVPFVGTEGRQVFGPSEAVFRNLLGEPLAFHLLNYSWLGWYPNLAGRVEGYGIACTPDRGGLPATLALWRLT